MTLKGVKFTPKGIQYGVISALAVGLPIFAYGTVLNSGPYSPLAAWSHEEILAYIHYHKLAIPPIYGWKNGFLCGTHPWPARQWTGSIENGWEEVYEIDQDIVKKAAEFIESAAEFLKSL